METDQINQSIQTLTGLLNTTMCDIGVGLREKTLAKITELVSLINQAPAKTGLLTFAEHNAKRYHDLCEEIDFYTANNLEPPLAYLSERQSLAPLVNGSQK